MWTFGEYVGIAFQIKDDLFDYDRSNAAGKPNGADIRDQKMTLPLIYLLNHSDFIEKRWIINTVKNHHDDAAKVSELFEKVAAEWKQDAAYPRHDKPKMARIWDTIKNLFSDHPRISTRIKKLEKLEIALARQQESC